MLSSIPIPTSTLVASSAIASSHPSLSLATNAAKEVASTLLKCAPQAMYTVKDIVHAGVAGEASRRDAFLTMMRPSAEAKEGIECWRGGKGVDWVEFKRGKGTAKL